MRTRVSMMSELTVIKLGSEVYSFIFIHFIARSENTADYVSIVFHHDSLFFLAHSPAHLIPH